MAIRHRSMLAIMILRSLGSNLRIAAWTLLTLATCAALVTLFTTVTLEVRSKMSRTLRGLGANAAAYPVAGAGYDWTEFEGAVRQAGARFVRLALRVGLVKESPVAVVAADVAALQDLTPYWAMTGKRAAIEGECLVGRHTAETLGIQTGQTVNVAWSDGSGPTSLTVVGIMETGDEDDDRIYVGSEAASGDFNYALLSIPGGEPAIARLQADLAAARSTIEIKPLRQIVEGEKHVLDKIKVLCLAALGAVVVLTALGVSASMLARVVERRKEFALLQALGAQRRSVAVFLLAESATVGGIAAALGFVLGTLLTGAVMRRIFSASVSPHGLAFGAALAVTAAVAVLAGAVACRRVMRFQAAAALRGE